MMGLTSIFGPSVHTATGDPRADWPTGLPDEEAALKRATPVRLREFRAGRTLARAAMAKCGLPVLAIPPANDRSPVWPQGVTGSISHCHDLCAAIVGRTADGIVSLGIDIEPTDPLPQDILGDVCVDEELDWLATLPQNERGIAARLIFSAKECAYKCQYSLSGQLIDFHAMSVEIDRQAGHFLARFQEDVLPFRRGDALEGRYMTTANHIVTGMVLSKEALSSIGLRE